MLANYDRNYDRNVSRSPQDNIIFKLDLSEQPRKVKTQELNFQLDVHCQQISSDHASQVTKGTKSENVLTWKVLWTNSMRFRIESGLCGLYLTNRTGRLSHSPIPGTCHHTIWSVVNWKFMPINCCELDRFEFFDPRKRERERENKKLIERWKDSTIATSVVWAACCGS